MNPPGTELRREAIRSLQATPLDLLILGGGIVGAGVARDAALRGLKVGLVEQHDFAFGTSSRSSRLLHGGLRYLAQGRIGLVREASLEKKIIHHIAPHLAEPLPFIFPTYRGNQHWRLWQLKIGVKVYDALCGGHNLGQSTWLSPREVLTKVPALTQTNLTGAVRYYDGFTNDARLTLDTLRSAANSGASVLNYCRFQNATRADGHSKPLTPALSPSDGERENRPPSRREPATAVCRTTTEISDEERKLSPLPRGGGEGQGEGERPTRRPDALWACEIEDLLGGSKFTVRARAVVNATGPWADGLPHSRVKLRLTKGVHIVVERARVPVPETVVMTEGQRILFAIPWGERTILGTTDTDYDGPLDQVNADTSDINYLLEITNQFFPDSRLTGRDVISSWAGLRPLLADPDGRPSDLSRSHEITNPEPGWWDVAGGKLTTYRLMAEQVVDQIVQTMDELESDGGAARGAQSSSSARLPASFSRSWSSALRGLRLRRPPSPRELRPCRTAQEPLLPASEGNGFSGILPPEFSRHAVEHYVANEWAIHLEDVMVRRTSWRYYHRDAAQKAELVADWMGELLGWSAAERRLELERVFSIQTPVANHQRTWPSIPEH